MTGPLDGMRVVEAATFLSGPYAGTMLADLGADVIKVEPPKGDPFRRFGRPDTFVSAVFANCNRGKRSVVLDLKEEADRLRMLDLVASADVLLSNWRPSVADRLGLGDAILVARNPALVRVYVSGFGPTGPRSDEPVFDIVIQARSGMTEALAPGDQPVLLPGYPVDKTTATMVTQATLAALLARERNGGRGERVDVSMLDAMGYVNFVDLFTSRTFADHQPADARNRHGSSLRPIRAADGWLVVAAMTAEQIRRACTAVGRPEWGAEVLGQTDPLAVVRVLFDRMEEATVTAPVAHWLERFAAHDVPAAPCLGIDDHLADAQVAHNRTYRTDEVEGLGRVRSPRYPAHFSASDLTDGRPVPRLGEHTAEVLGGLTD